MTYETTIKTRAFNGKLESVSVTVEDDGTIRAYDPIAGYHTTCHSIPKSTQARLRRKAA